VGNSIFIALISLAGVVLSAAIGYAGVVVSRRSDKDDDTREWVAIRMKKQDEDIAALRGEMVEVRAALTEATAANAKSERQVYSLVGYVRSLLAWIAAHLPNETPPAPYGPAQEVLDR
jgi:hypothetical protein